jgi:hypothetical protein
MKFQSLNEQHAYMHGENIQLYKIIFANSLNPDLTPKFLHFFIFIFIYIL